MPLPVSNSHCRILFAPELDSYWHTVLVDKSFLEKVQFEHMDILDSFLWQQVLRCGRDTSVSVLCRQR